MRKWVILLNQQHIQIWDVFVTLTYYNLKKKIKSSVISLPNRELEHWHDSKVSVFPLMHKPNKPQSKRHKKNQKTALIH